MFVGIGTTINILAILLGSAIGVFAGAKFPERIRALMTDVLGAITILGAASAAISLWSVELRSALPRGWPLLVILISLILGGLIGSMFEVESRLESWGVRLKNRFDSRGESPFVEGFVTASLVFAIGPLAILGSISDGMATGIDQLALKSTLDFFAAVAFASAFGWGVAASALPVGIYQGLWTLIGFGLGTILEPYQVAAMTATGSVLLLGIAFKLLGIKTMRVADLLPALAIAPLLALLVNRF